MTQPAVAMGWDRIRVAIPRVVEAGFAIFVVVGLGVEVNRVPVSPDYLFEQLHGART